MNLKVKILAIFFGVSVYVTAINVARAEPMGTDDMSSQSVPTPPEKSPLIAVSVTPLLIGARTLGQVVLYDDPATARPADGFEVYDSAGNLLAIAWFDRFGIRRLTVDRALVQSGDEPEGIFVWVVDGEPV